MLICAMDTSGREGSVALAEGDARSFDVLQFAPIAGGTYSARLIPSIASLLKAAGRQRSDIQLLVAASGPGSFTGLRVGLSTVKALAEVLNVPVVAISVLEAIAFATRKAGLLLTALDAQRGEVFVGEYQATSQKLGLINEALVVLGDFTTWLSARNPIPVTYTPDAVIENRVRESGSPAEPVARPGADVYARLGLQKFLAGETVPADILDANYIRRSDAEIFSLPKQNNPSK